MSAELDLGRDASPPVAPGRTNILGVGVTALTMRGAVAALEGWIARSERHYVAICTVATIMECQRSERLRDTVNRASLVAPDGMPLVWLSRLAGNRRVTRVCGPDLLPEMASRSAATGARHYFYGGTEGVASRLAEGLTERFPGLNVAGVYSPPFGTVEELATPAVAEVINAARPDIVWVGVSTPKQERWMEEMRGRLHAPVLIGVGAAFDFHSGQVRRAPSWMRRIGLEWLYRLWREPRRLWRRYLLDNPAFLLLVTCQAIGLRKFELD